MIKYAKVTHIHKYQRTTIGSKGKFIVYRCALPDCSHYIPPELVVGRRSLCNSCANEIIINRDDITIGTIKPICEDCKERNRIKREYFKSLPTENIDRNEIEEEYKGEEE